MDTAVSALKVANTNKIQIDIKKQNLADTKAAVAQAEATLINAKSNVYQNQMKNEAIRQASAQIVKTSAAVNNAKTQLGYTTVKAPRDGVVTSKYVEVGSVVTSGKSSMGNTGKGITIVDIADISRMRVVVDVDETDIGKIKMNQKVDVTVDAYSDEHFSGKVIKIAPIAAEDQNVTTIPVTVELSKTDRRLKPEMNATCDFIVQKAEDVLYLPVDAVTATDNGQIVNVMKDGKPVPKKVQVGISGDDYIEIVSGLNEGDKVAIIEAPTDSSSNSNSNNKRHGGPPMM